MTSEKVTPDTPAADYRYPNATRKNNPPAGLAAQGRTKEAARVRFEYDPHLPPVLRFDQKAEAEKLLEKASRQALSAEDVQFLARLLEQQQPWLEWAGKREQKACEVEPVALHIHERVSTQAILRVAARQDIPRTLFADPEQEYRDAVQFYQHDVQWSNRLILGDSLQVMASLAKREDLAGKVQMIYVDPPYGIKYASNFQSEVGNRVVGEKEVDLTREPETVKAYRDTWTLGVHSYLSYLRDRLTAAKELLTDSGSVFVQISDENVHRVRTLMDEVFGAKQSVATIAYKKASPQTNRIKNGFNYLLWYCKDIEQVKVQKLYRPRSVGDGTTEDPRKLALWLQDRTGYERTLTTDEKRGDVELPVDALVFRADKVRDNVATEDKVFPFEYNGELLSPGRGFAWRGRPDEMERLKKANRLLRTDETLAYKLFMTDSGGVELTSLWEDTAGKIPDMRYVVQTNEKIITRCILMTTSIGDLVLDPTCGSGTTANLAEQWGRRWITIDSSRVPLAIARQRLLTAKFDYHKIRPVTADDQNRNPNGTWLRDPQNIIDGPCTFVCETVPHIMLKSIAQNVALDPVFAVWAPILAEKLEKLNLALMEVTPELRKNLHLKLAQKEKLNGNSSVRDFQ